MDLMTGFHCSLELSFINDTFCLDLLDLKIIYLIYPLLNLSSFNAYKVQILYKRIYYLIYIFIGLKKILRCYLKINIEKK